MIKNKDELFSHLFEINPNRYSGIGHYSFLGGAIMGHYELDFCPKITTKSIWKDCKDSKKGIIRYPFTIEEFYEFLEIKEKQSS